MSARRRRSRRRPASESGADINLTSLLDIVFVLLIAFMIVAPALTHSLEVELPSADPPDNVATPDPPEAKTLSIGWGGSAEGPHKLDVDGVAIPGFAELVDEAKTWPDDQTVAIAVDRRVPSEWLLRAAVSLQSAGVAGYHFVYKDDGGRGGR